MARTVVPPTDITPTQATLTTSLAGSNNDLVFTAKEGGQWGNSIQVEYLNPGGTNALAISVLGYVISVSLATSGGSITSTASEVKTALDADTSVRKLITTALAGSNDGTGVVTALTATALSGGTWSVLQPSLTNGDATNDHYFTGNDGQMVIEVVSSDAGSQTVTIKRSPVFRAGTPLTDEVVSVAAGATRFLGPFPKGEFDQNGSGDVYFDPSVSNTLDFRVWRLQKV